MSSPGDESAPERIGPYKVLELVGEGGMGEVYVAEQRGVVRRKVAIKVIKRGMDTKAVLARFESERQALAIMDHPSIAKVLDSGETDGGRPYFVMEYVHGVPITDYCNLHKLPTEERLELFVELCGAVQHAHQKGVIHRDLKPSNVLVTVEQDHPTPKVIDFGIAKAIGQKLTELTLHTQQGQAIGTPAYMSPEQAEMTGLDVDTRTDVYTLGVMLYELLVGTLPIDIREIPHQGLSAALRESDPPKPSARFHSLGEHQDRIADLRQTDPGSLRSELKGDLDWIVMKAMEKDRTHRYETVNGLALDIQRHLNDEPVRAGSPSAAYRMRKFARRHRLGVTAGAAVAIGLIGGSVLATMGMVRARRAERVAAGEAAAAAEVAGFLEGLFEVSDPGEARGNSITAREILDEGAEQIRVELAGQPVTQARLMNSMGNVYRSLGLYREAASLLERAVVLRESQFGDDHPDVAESLHSLANVYLRQGRYAEADSSWRRALSIRERTQPPGSADVARTMIGIGNIAFVGGDLPRADSVYSRALAILEAAVDPGDAELGRLLNNIASVRSRQGEYAAADSLWRRALSSLETALGSDHPDVARILVNLANVARNQGEYEEAEPLYRRALAVREQTQGPDHAQVGEVLISLANLYSLQARFGEAEESYLRALAILETAKGADHADVAVALENLAGVRLALERLDEAEPAFRRALAILEGAFGEDHPRVTASLGGLGEVYLKRGMYDEAERHFRRALKITESAYPPDHFMVGLGLRSFADLFNAQGRYPEAEDFGARALTILENAPGSDPQYIALGLRSLATIYRNEGRHGEAEPRYLRAISIQEEQLGSSHPDLAETLEEYTVLLREDGRASEARSVEARAEAIRDSQDSRRGTVSPD